MYWVLAFGPSSKPSASKIIQIIIYEFTLLSHWLLRNFSTCIFPLYLANELLLTQIAGISKMEFLETQIMWRSKTCNTNLYHIQVLH
jgi:hypothetical protein